MKMLRNLFALGLICSLAGVARASNFQMVVVDPLPSYVNIITAADLPLTVSLSTCQAGQVPSGAGDPTYDGCYSGLNDTGKTLSNLELLVPVISGFTPTCTPAPGEIFFTNVSCNGLTSDGKDYIFLFSGGPGIPTATDCDHDNDGGNLNGDDFSASCNAGTIFTIAESGAPVSDFAHINVIANTPEPSSFWLLSTGVLSAGVFFGDRRRRNLCPTRA